MAPAVGLDRSRLANKNSEPVAAGVSRQVDQDIDLVLADLIAQALVGPLRRVAPAVGDLLELVRQAVLDRRARIAHDLERRLIGVLQHGLEYPRGGMTAKIRRHVTDHEAPIRIAHVAMRRPRRHRDPGADPLPPQPPDIALLLEREVGPEIRGKYLVRDRVLEVRPDRQGIVEFGDRRIDLAKGSKTLPHQRVGMKRSGIERQPAFATRDRLREPLQLIQRVAATDPGLRQAGRQRQRLVEVRDRLLDFIERQPYRRAIGDGFRVIRPDLEGALQADERLLEVTQIGRYPAAPVVRLGEIGIDGNRLVEAVPRLGEAAELAQDVAAVVERFREVRIEGNRLVIAVQGFVATPQRTKHAGAHVQRLGMIGIERQRLLEAVQGLLVPAELVQDHAAAVPGGVEILADRKRLVVIGERFVGAAQHQADIAEIVEGDRVVRIERNGAPIARAGLFETAEREQHHAPVQMRLGRTRLDFGGLAEMLLGFVIAARVILRHAEQVQRIEMPGRQPKQLRQGGLRVGKQPGIVQLHRPLEQLRDLGLLRLLVPRLIECARTTVPAHGLPFESLPLTLPQ